MGSRGGREGRMQRATASLPQDPSCGPQPTCQPCSLLRGPEPAQPAPRHRCSAPDPDALAVLTRPRVPLSLLQPRGSTVVIHTLPARGGCAPPRLQHTHNKFLHTFMTPKKPLSPSAATSHRSCHSTPVSVDRPVLDSSRQRNQAPLSGSPPQCPGGSPCWSRHQKVLPADG